MKRILLSALIVCIALSLFVSCKNEPKPEEPKVNYSLPSWSNNYHHPAKVNSTIDITTEEKDEADATVTSFSSYMSHINHYGLITYYNSDGYYSVQDNSSTGAISMKFSPVGNSKVVYSGTYSEAHNVWSNENYYIDQNEVDKTTYDNWCTSNFSALGGETKKISYFAGELNTDTFAWFTYKENGETYGFYTEKYILNNETIFTYEEKSKNGGSTIYKTINGKNVVLD